MSRPGVLLHIPSTQLEIMSIGRNDPCHCGSGKKYKKCCQELDRQADHTPPETLDNAFEDALESKFRGQPEEGPDQRLVHRLHPDTQVLVMHPYSYCKVAAMLTQLLLVARDSKWNKRIDFLTSIQRLGTEELEEKLRPLVVGYDRKRLVEEGVAGESVWFRTAKWPTIGTLSPEEAINIRLATCELWKRFCPDKPSLEMVDDWITDGAACHFEDDYEGALQAWYMAIDFLLDRVTPEMKSLREAGEVLLPNMFKGLSELVLGFGKVATDSSPMKLELALVSIDLLKRVLATFPNDPDAPIIICELGDIYYLNGQLVEGDEFYTLQLMNHPGNLQILSRFLDRILDSFKAGVGIVASARRGLLLVEQFLPDAVEGDGVSLWDYRDELREIIADHSVPR